MHFHALLAAPLAFSLLAASPAAQDYAPGSGAIALKNWTIQDYAEAEMTLQEVVDAWAQAEPGGGSPQYMSGGATGDGDYYLMVSPDGEDFFLYDPREGTGSFGDMPASNAPATPPGQKVAQTGGMVGVVLGGPNPPNKTLVYALAAAIGGLVLGYAAGKATKKA